MYAIKVKKILFILALLGLSIGISIYIGFRIGSGEKSFWYYKINRANQLLHEWFVINRSDPEAQETEIKRWSVDSTLLTVHFESKKISTARTPFDGPYENNGGAIDRYNDQVLFLDPRGQFFLGGSLDAIHKLSILGPKTNRAEYEKYDGHPDYKNTEFQKTPLKYNDVKYLNTETGGKILVSYTEFDKKDPCFRNVVSYVELTQPLRETQIKESDWKPIYKSDPCLPLMKSGSKAMFGEGAGGMIEILNDKTIYYANGDFLYKDIAQDPSADYGKVLKIDLVSGHKEIYSSGFRNPKGLELDSNGRLWLVENGPRGGDELNLIEERANYGWPIESYGTDYYGGPMSYSTSYGKHGKFKKPVFSWLPSIAPSEVIQVNDFHEYWNGDFIITTLLAQSLYRLHVEDGSTIFVEKIHLGERIRDILQLGEKLVIYTDSMNIIFLTVEPIKIQSNLTSWFGEEYSTKEASRIESITSVCKQCHSFFGNDNARAPNLQRVFADRLGSTPFLGYTEAFKQADAIWDEQLLRQFIANPNEIVPGTSMPNPGIDSEEDIEIIIKYLKYLDTIK